jgi:hypothetical protein
MSFKPKDHTIPKACKTCGIVKNPEEFYIINRTKDRKHLGPARHAHCIPCRSKKVSEAKKKMGDEWHKIENERKRKWAEKNSERNKFNLRNAWLKRQYGITENEYIDLFKKQDGLCAICKKPEGRYNKKTNQIKKLAVDHCHSTGKVRELLCFACNSSLGKFEDSIEILQNAIAYLKRHRSK